MNAKNEARKMWEEATKNQEEATKLLNDCPESKIGRRLLVKARTQAMLAERYELDAQRCEFCGDDLHQTDECGNVKR